MTSRRIDDRQQHLDERRRVLSQSIRPYAMRISRRVLPVALQVFGGIDELIGHGVAGQAKRASLFDERGEFDLEFGDGHIRSPRGVCATLAAATAAIGRVDTGASFKGLWSLWLGDTLPKESLWLPARSGQCAAFPA